MGYTTKYEGVFRIEPTLSDDTAALYRDTVKRIWAREPLPESIKHGGMPDSYLQWELTKDNSGLEWDGNEKFYHASDWLQWVIDRILLPRGYRVSGHAIWQGEEIGDVGVLVVKNGTVERHEKVVAWPPWPQPDLAAARAPVADETIASLISDARQFGLPNSTATKMATALERVTRERDEARAERDAHAANYEAQLQLNEETRAQKNRALESLRREREMYARRLQMTPEEKEGEAQRLLEIERDARHSDELKRCQDYEAWCEANQELEKDRDEARAALARSEAACAELRQSLTIERDIHCGRCGVEPPCPRCRDLNAALANDAGRGWVQISHAADVMEDALVCPDCKGHGVLCSHHARRLDPSISPDATGPAIEDPVVALVEAETSAEEAYTRTLDEERRKALEGAMSHDGRQKVTRCIGEPAPDPQHVAHRQYRRRVAPAGGGEGK